MSSRPRIIYLDTLRFLASAAVLAQHALETRYAAVIAWISPGVFGVVLFFMISGFVIPMAVERRFDLATFCIRRAFRIFPLVVASLLAFAILGRITSIPAFAEARLADGWAWVANLLLVQDYVDVPGINGVTWTLSLEVAWYGLFAVSLILAGEWFDRVLVVAAPIGMGSAGLLSLLIHHRLPLGRAGLIYCAVIGCRTYQYVQGRIDRRRLVLDFAVFLAVCAGVNVISFGYFSHPRISVEEAVLPWMLAPCVFMVVCGFARLRNAWLLNLGLFGWLGTISYSTYLLHPIALALSTYFSPSWLSLAAGLVGTLLLSWAGYRLVEVPGQAVGRYLASPGRAWAVQAR